MAEPCLLAIDLGGTKTAVAMARRDADGPAPYLSRHLFPTPQTAMETLAVLMPAVDRLAAEHTVAGVGVSFGGHVGDNGARLRSLHVPGWQDLPLSEELSRATGAPVRIANDAEAGAIGEYACLPARGINVDLAYLTVSTGIGGALVLNGRLHHGRHGLAGEVGHIRMRDDGRCSCGGTGHLEAWASGPAIARTARRRLSKQPERRTMLRHVVRTHGVLTARDVADVARAGDPLAAEVLADAGDLVGRAVALLGLIVDPDIVLIGGGVAQAGEAFWAPLRAATRDNVLRHLEVRPAPLGAHSALRGAVELAREGAAEPIPRTSRRQSVSDR